MPAAAIECLPVRYWKTLHWAPLRQLYLETLKIVLVSSLTIESKRCWLQSKRTVAFGLYLKGLEMSFIARTTIERCMWLTPILPPIYFLTVEDTHALHDV